MRTITATGGFSIWRYALSGAVLVLAMLAGGAQLRTAAAETLTVCSSGCTHTTIQAAIDAAVAGDVIDVQAGTYNEQLVINKDVTIDGGGVAVLQPGALIVGAWDVQFVSGANGATLQNMVLDFNGADGLRDGRGIGISDFMGPAVTGVTIHGNDITMGVGKGASTGGLEGVGIQTGKDADVSGLVISGNDFHAGSVAILDGAAAGEEGIYINPNAGAGPILITGNTFDGELFTGISLEAHNVTVDGNSVTRPSPVPNTRGIRLNNFVGAVTYAVTINNNTVSGFENGLRFGTGSTALATLTVSAMGNAISNNTIGILARHDVSVTANRNSIAGNAAGAQLEATAAGPFDATCNWWGAADGPSGPGGTGSGDSVSLGIDFAPWLLSFNGNCVEQHTFAPDATTHLYCFIYSGETATASIDFETLFAPGINGVSELQLPAGNWLSWFRGFVLVQDFTIVTGSVLCVSGTGDEVFAP